MNLFFDPIEAPFQMCCATGACAACCASEAASLLEKECSCGGCGGVCSGFAGRWGFSRIWKGLTLFIVFFLYVFALVWIVAIHQGVQTCDLGGIHSDTVVDAMMGLTLANNGKLPTAIIHNITRIAGCDPSTCQFSMGGTAVGIETYVNFRLSIYLISAAPVLYLLCMLVLHMQQASNVLITALYPKEADTLPAEVDPNNVLDVLFNASSAFEPQNWHLFWLSMMVTLNLVLGVIALAMDISLAQSLSSDWGGRSACYIVEQNMVHYQPGVRISLKDLPVALCVPCLLYTIWSVMFLVNSAINLCRRKLSNRYAPPQSNAAPDIPLQQPPVAVLSPPVLASAPAAAVPNRIV